MSDEKQTSNTKSARGVWHEVADVNKIPLEETAWVEAAVEKHLKSLEDMKNENKN